MSVFFFMILAIGFCFENMLPNSMFNILCFLLSFNFTFPSKIDFCSWFEVVIRNCFLFMPTQLIEKQLLNRPFFLSLFSQITDDLSVTLHLLHWSICLILCCPAFPLSFPYASSFIVRFDSWHYIFSTFLFLLHDFIHVFHLYIKFKTPC